MKNKNKSRRKNHSRKRKNNSRRKNNKNLIGGSDLEKEEDIQLQFALALSFEQEKRKKDKTAHQEKEDSQLQKTLEHTNNSDMLKLTLTILKGIGILQGDVDDILIHLQKEESQIVASAQRTKKTAHTKEVKELAEKIRSTKFGLKNKNPGNRCFMNAYMQCFIRTPEVLECILSIPGDGNPNTFEKRAIQVLKSIVEVIALHITALGKGVPASSLDVAMTKEEPQAALNALIVKEQVKIEEHSQPPTPVYTFKKLDEIMGEKYNDDNFLTMNDGTQQDANDFGLELFKLFNQSYPRRVYYSGNNVSDKMTFKKVKELCDKGTFKCEGEKTFEIDFESSGNIEKLKGFAKKIGINFEEAEGFVKAIWENVKDDLEEMAKFSGVKGKNIVDTLVFQLKFEELRRKKLKGLEFTGLEDLVKTKFTPEEIELFYKKNAKCKKEKRKSILKYLDDLDDQTLLDVRIFAANEYNKNPANKKKEKKSFYDVKSKESRKVHLCSKRDELYAELNGGIVHLDKDEDKKETLLSILLYHDKFDTFQKSFQYVDEMQNMKKFLKVVSLTKAIALGFDIDQLVFGEDALPTSELENIFFLQTETVRECLACKYKEDPKFTKETVLSVGILGESLLECLNNPLSFMSQETLEDARCIKCGEMGGQKRDIMLNLNYLPPFLQIQLKRYVKGPKGVEKISRKLEINKDLTLNEEGKFDDKGSGTGVLANYSLYGIIYHQGRTPGHGHYYTVVKQGVKWYEYNDTFVDEITDINQELNTMNALTCSYLLFYQRVDL